jgi:hypothetical protein
MYDNHELVSHCQQADARNYSFSIPSASLREVVTMLVVMLRLKV